MTRVSAFWGYEGCVVRAGVFGAGRGGLRAGAGEGGGDPESVGDKSIWSRVVGSVPVAFPSGGVAAVLPGGGVAAVLQVSHFARRAAFPACARVHATDVSDVQHVDGRDDRPGAGLHRDRDAAGRRFGRGVASQPRARLLRDPQLRSRSARVVAGGLPGDGVRPARCGDPPGGGCTLFGRSGRKVWGAHYLHDGAQPEGSGQRTRWGNCWVVVVLVVELPCLGGRQVGLPVLFRLFRPKDDSHPNRCSQPELWRLLVDMVIKRFPGRTIELVMDGAYASRAWRDLPARVNVTTRMRANAALHKLAAGSRTPARQGRPPLKGARLGSLAEIANAATFVAVTI